MVGIFSNKYFRIKQWISVSLATLLKVSFQEILFFLGGVGISVAAVQLVPYVSFSHQFTFDLRNIKWQRVPLEVDPKHS